MLRKAGLFVVPLAPVLGAVQKQDERGSDLSMPGTDGHERRAGPPEPVVMQRENERSRVVVEGKRTDDGTRCALVVIQEVNGTWALYPHGWDRWGVRLTKAEAVKAAQAILNGAR